MIAVNKAEGRSERRRAKRVDAKFIVTCKLDMSENMPVWVGSGEVDALMVDLSERGMGIISKHDIPKATNFFINFTLINLYAADDDSRIRSISVSGAVCHTTLLNKVERRLGVCFTRINKEDRLAIADFVNMQPNQ